jgi:hypothetical protein
MLKRFNTCTSKRQTIMIENKTTNTIVFYYGAFCHSLYPGINILSEFSENLINEDPLFKEYVSRGLMVNRDTTDKVHVDAETNMQFIDDSGQKIPVSVENTPVIPPDDDSDDDSDRVSNSDDDVSDSEFISGTSLQFKAAQLINAGISKAGTTAILSKMPDGGYQNIAELPELSSPDKLKAAKLF